MHSRRLTWCGIIIGGLLYQACKPFVGMVPNWETAYDATFWLRYLNEEKADGPQAEATEGA